MYNLSHSNTEVKEIERCADLNPRKAGNLDQYNARNKFYEAFIGTISGGYAVSRMTLPSQTKNTGPTMIDRSGPGPRNKYRPNAMPSPPAYMTVPRNTSPYSSA